MLDMRIKNAAAVLTAVSIGALALSGCSSDSTTQESSPALAQPSASVSRQAGVYRDARLCIKNNTTEKLFLSPGDDTLGQLMTQKPGKENCFDSNDTAKANATVVISHEDGMQYLVGAENFMIKPPKVYTCTPFEASVNTCGSVIIPRAKLDEQVLTENATGTEIVAGNHRYVPKRLPDADYFIVVQLDVNK